MLHVVSTGASVPQAPECPKLFFGGSQQKYLPKHALRKTPHFFWCRDRPQRFENSRRESQEIHDLRNTGARKPLLSRKLRHCESPITGEFRLPVKGNMNGMRWGCRASFRHHRGCGDLLDVIIGIGERMDHEWTCSPAHDGHGHDSGYREPSSTSCIVCGAISITWTCWDFCRPSGLKSLIPSVF